jgi:hypothetical protein
MVCILWLFKVERNLVRECETSFNNNTPAYAETILKVLDYFVKRVMEQKEEALFTS